MCLRTVVYGSSFINSMAHHTLSAGEGGKGQGMEMDNNVN